MPNPGDPITVLHVDDQADFCELTKASLERHDELAIETATSASEGLERLGTKTFDCVVSDYDMPGQNGIEFLEAVRAEYPELPFMCDFLCRSCCLDCAPETIATPTLGTVECRLTARLVVQSDVTKQRHRLVLAESEGEAFAPAADGTSPWPSHFFQSAN